ncbi:hypothetical protein [Hymenobacter terrestris]|uniref:T9SS type A sorting domain-containing protein n=1 Tax=Hymenobacter terrestris TaxID=2748310 RepID=A0ABX2PYR3_9BACT|nr:hypothetical protein [Hymenobacter terrestris]NVO83265.1 hypothetical protein [Hymenobacter terrestris]
MSVHAWARALLVVGALFSSVPGFASHARGGEIYYTPVPGTANTYHITVRKYAVPPSPVVVEYGPDMELVCGQGGCSSTSAGSFVAKLLLTSSTRVLAPDCTAGSAIQVLVYEGDVELPPARWTLSMGDVNRTFGLLNLENSGNQSQYVESFLDNSSGLRNSSPQFIESRVPLLLGNQRQLYSFSAFDADGDSLVYQLVQPLQGGWQIAGSGIAPCAQPTVGFTPSHFQLNEVTGEAQTIPFTLAVGAFVMAVRVQEYRRLNASWTLIGSITRDLAYFARASSNSTPSFTSLQVGTVGQPFDKAIEVIPGQTIAVLLDATDADADQILTFSSAATTIVPGVALQPVSATQARLTWQVPADLPSGRYYLPVTVTDNGCPLFGSESRSVAFLVTARRVLSTGPTQPAAALFAVPTPFREQVEFRLRQPGTQPVTVWDALGRVVAQLVSTPDGRVVWRPENHLVAGMYLARTADGQQVRLLRE